LQFLSKFAFFLHWEATGCQHQNKKLNFVVENKEGVSTFTLRRQRKEKIKVQRKDTKPKFRFTHKQNNGFYDTISKSQNLHIYK
jgi:hypothetical protein